MERKEGRQAFGEKEGGCTGILEEVMIEDEGLEAGKGGRGGEDIGTCGTYGVAAEIEGAEVGEEGRGGEDGKTFVFEVVIAE